MSIQKEMPDVNEFVVADDALSARPTNGSSAVSSGWDAAIASIKSEREYASEFKCSEEPQIIKFLDQTGPFAVYKQHFLNKTGKRSYIWDGSGPSDPLQTLLGSRAEDKRGFTIANLSEKPVKRQMLIASVRLFKTLHASHFSAQGPLQGTPERPMYWALSRTGKMQSTVYHLTPIKQRDLMEDYGIDPVVAEAEIAKMQCFTVADLNMSSYDELLRVAQELS